MENANPPPTNNRPVLSAVLHSIEQFLNNFANQPNKTDMSNLESDDESVDTPLVSPFPHSDNDSDDGEVLNELTYNTIMVEGLESTGKNLVAIVVLENIGEFNMSNMAEVLMGRSFRKITKLKYDVAKGLVSFTKIFDTYIFRMPRTIPRLKRFNWSKVSPLLDLSQHDLMSELRHPYEKNKFMYKNCLNLGPEYQVDESMKEWLIHGNTEHFMSLLRMDFES
ncbi:hypothetical protein Tco_1417243 [Tanacetum coccineum]